MRRVVAVLLAALLGLFTSACELRLDLGVEVERRGDGTLTLTVGMDRRLQDELAAADVDLFAGLEQLRERTAGWEIERVGTADGGVELRAAARFERPEELEALVAGFHGSLDGEDPELAQLLRLVPREEGGWALEGAVGLQPPSSPGARGLGVDVTGEDIARLLEERDDLVRYTLRAHLPGEVIDHDADRVEDDGTLIWDLPLATSRHVSAEAESVLPFGPAAVLAGAGALLVVLVLLAWWRRR